MKRFHSLLVVLLLLAYAGTATSIMPAVFAALAELDGSHRVLICRTEQGMEVRLHHREDDYTPEVCDHEGMLGRLVVSFCHPAEEGDHSLSTNQVTGTVTGPDEEAKRFMKEQPCGSLELVDFDGRQLPPCPFTFVFHEKIPLLVLSDGRLRAGRHLPLVWHEPDLL